MQNKNKTTCNTIIVIRLLLHINPIQKLCIKFKRKIVEAGVCYFPFSNYLKQNKNNR